MLIKNNLKKLKNIIFPLSSFREKLKWKNQIRIIGKNSEIRSTIFEGFNMIGNSVSLVNCYIGKGSYISHNTRLIGSKIGNYCSIADNVTTGLGHHPLNTISTHPAFFYDTKRQLGWNLFSSTLPLSYDPYKKIGNSKYSTVIGHDVWVGSHVLIMDGISIGTGAVVGAGAVVTKDVPPFAIVAGVPAKIIRYRHKNEDIDAILKSQWWENDPVFLTANIENLEIKGIKFIL